MEIKRSNVATLSNYEVMSHLHKIKDRKNKTKGQLATITYETLRYLEKSPCAQQTTQSVVSCLKALEAYNINKNEKLMILNNPPTTPLEIQLIIEESEERLSDDQVEEILQLVITHLNVAKPTEEAAPE